MHLSGKSIVVTGATGIAAAGAMRAAREGASVFIVSQFWAFANDLYTPEQGKRLFAIVGFGGTLALIIAAATIVGHAVRVARANPIHALRYE